MTECRSFGAEPAQCREHADGRMMARRRKKKQFSATKAVKSLARETIGSPPPVQRIPTLKESDKGRKHKPTLGKLLAEE